MHNLLNCYIMQKLALRIKPGATPQESPNGATLIKPGAPPLESDINKAWGNAPRKPQRGDINKARGTAPGSFVIEMLEEVFTHPL